MSKREELQSWCRNYGTFCGMWHSNEFWMRTLRESENMTEDECERKMNAIRKEADSDLEAWRQCQ